MIGRMLGGFLARRGISAGFKVAGKVKPGLGLKKASLQLGGARSSANASAFEDRAYSKTARRISAKIRGF